ncbi:MAG TPA: protein-L-isoaspartate(D-aspartate) O-methyltransferase [Candidatus Polarisedimenticolia bacterium]|nr:protein-L-isoaspartate(D-aspartate) O-methyltransferase [Candidatus Polarisedimenticolia bacterium]
MSENSGLETKWARLRENMVRSQIEARGIRDPRVLRAMRKVPRHRFVDAASLEHAYEDRPLPIGLDQTISQPYIVAFMTEQLQLRGGERILEVGTGSGYQTAVLAEMGGEVFTLEIHEPLSRIARQRLAELGYGNVRFAVGDGRQGWPEEAPFGAILAAASAEAVPPALLEQLAIGGRLVLPLGVEHQDLMMITRTAEGDVARNLLPVRFVPLVHG